MLHAQTNWFCGSQSSALSAVRMRSRQSKCNTRLTGVVEAQMHLLNSLGFSMQLILSFHRLAEATIAIRCCPTLFVCIVGVVSRSAETYAAVREHKGGSSR